MKSRLVFAVLWMGLGTIVFADETLVPKWDARGLGLLPAQGIACLDVNQEGSRVVIGTFASPGNPNIHVLDISGQLRFSYRAGQRGIGQVAATLGDSAYALCTMTNGTSGDEPLAYFCGEPALPVVGGSGGISLFHYGDHSNHIGKQLRSYSGGAVTINENQLLWLTANQTPHARSSFRNLKPTALAVHPSGVAVIGGYVDGDPRTTIPANVSVFLPGATTPMWSRPVVNDVALADPPERGEYGWPTLSDGTRNPLPQRDEPMSAPLSIAVTREVEFSESTTRLATADYRGWQRWIRSSATGKDENYGTRFMPARPTVTVFDAKGTELRRFDAAKFSNPAWVDLVFLPGGDSLLAYPHHWTCRGLAGQSILPADDHASTVWLLNVKNGEVRPREFPDAVASVSVSDTGSIIVSCWNQRLYQFNATSIVDGPLPQGIEVGGPALVHINRDGSQIITATTKGEVTYWSPKGEILQKLDLNQVVSPTEKPWVKNAKATPLAKGLWQLPGGRVESDLGGQRVIEAPDGLILIEAHAGLSFESEWAAMEAAGLDPRRVKYVLATHEHGDHAPGAYLWRVATGAQFICSRQMAYTLQHHLPMGTGYGLHPPVPTDLKIDEDTELDLAGLKVGALRLPGHTFGSMGWLFERDGKRFVAIGDLIMPEGRLGYAGSINFSPYQVLDSLRKLDGLNVDLILPGHGPVVGPDKYVAAGIAIGSRVGWGKMTPEKPDPRFAITQPNILVTAFLAAAVSGDFGDINGDGLPDVAIVAPHRDGSIVKIFLNHPDRDVHFDPMQADREIPVPAVGSPSKIRIFPKDQMAMGNSSIPNSIFISGQSTAAILTATDKPDQYDIVSLSGTELHQIRVVDVAGDGGKPVLLGRFSGTQLVVPGPDQRPTVKPLIPVLQAPYVDLHELDLNGDGRTDWVANHGKVWLRGSDGRIPESPSQQLPVPAVNEWSYCSVGDLNGDHKPDVVLISNGPEQRRLITVFHNTGRAQKPFSDSPDVAFEFKSQYPFVRDTAPVADWNGDGIDDLIIGLGQDNQVRIFLGHTTGLSPDRVQSIALEFWIHYEHSLKVADFNADGRLDLACFGYTATGVGMSGPPTAYVWLQPK